MSRLYISSRCYKSRFSTADFQHFQKICRMKFSLLLYVSCAWADAISMNRYINNRHVISVRKRTKQIQPDFFIQTLMKLQHAGKSHLIKNYMKSFQTPLKKISRRQNFRFNRFRAKNRRYEPPRWRG